MNPNYSAKYSAGMKQHDGDEGWQISPLHWLCFAPPIPVEMRVDFSLISTKGGGAEQESAKADDGPCMKSVRPTHHYRLTA
jgi:hypothetical protein